MNVRVLLYQIPVEPVCLIIVAVGIVVAMPRMPGFIAHEDHRHSHREHRDGKKVLYLTVAEFFDGGVVGRSFHAAVPAQIVIRAISIFLTVRLVVLVVVRNQVIQGESIVAGYEIDALLRFALLVAVNLRTADESIGKPAQGTAFATEESRAHHRGSGHSIPSNCLR